MPKTPKYEPGKWKSWEYSRPTFDSEKQAVTWGMGQVARLHSAFGVKPDTPATCVHYEDQSIGIYTFVEEKIAVELDIKPTTAVAGVITEWTCTGLHAHL